MLKKVPQYAICVIITGFLLIESAHAADNNAELQKKISSLTNEYENIKRMHKLLLGKVKDLQGEREELKKSSEALQFKLADKEAEVEKLAMAAEEAKKVPQTEYAAPGKDNAARELQGSIEALSKEIATLKIENERKRRESVVYRAEKGEAIKKLRATEALLAAQESDVKETQARIGELEAQIAAKEKEALTSISGLEKSKRKADGQISALEKKLEAALSELKTAQAGFQAKKDELKSAESSLKEAHSEQRTKEKSLAQEVAELKRKFTSENAKRAGLQSEKEKLEKELNETRRALKSENEDIAAEVAGLKESINTDRLKYKQLETEKLKLEEELGNFALDKKRLEEKVEGAFAALKSREEQLSMEIDKLRKAETKSAQVEELSGEVGNLQAELAKRGGAEETILALQDRVEYLHVQDNQTRELAEALKRQYEEKEKEARKFSYELSKAKADAKVRENYINRLKGARSAFERESEEGASDTRKFEKELEAMRSRLNANNKKLASMQEERKATALKIKKLEKEAKTGAKNASKQYDALKGQSEKLKKELAEKDKKLKSVQKELKKKNIKFELKKAKLDIAKENKQLNKAVENLEEKLSDEQLSFKEKIARLSAKNSRLKTDAGKAKSALKTEKRMMRASGEEAKRAALRMNNELLNAHYNLAVVFDKGGRYEDAELEYLECLEVNPEDAAVHYNLGILYDDKLNSNKEAIRHYQRFLELRPKGDEATRVKEWLFNLEQEIRIGAHLR